MKRLITAAIAVPLALAAVFYLPPPWFFITVLAVMMLATREYIELVGRWAAEAPFRSLYLFVPLAALLSTPDLLPPWGAGPESMLALFAVSVIMSSLILLSRVPLDQATVAVGLLAFGTAYLALPVASLYLLQQLDPWLVLLLLAIVWLGDTAAYYVGSSLGRHKLAPRVSPNKTWEGSCANLVAAVLVTVVWSRWRLGSIPPIWIGLALLTSLAAQLGDLVESMLKRGAGVKDSGNLFPGHGGVLDRIDALMFAAPALTLVLLVFEARLPLP